MVFKLAILAAYYAWLPVRFGRWLRDSAIDALWWLEERFWRVGLRRE